MLRQLVSAVRPRFGKINSSKTLSETIRHNSSDQTTPHPLMQFFDDTKNWGSTEVKSGRAWRIDELRIKSNSDLHKLWFVLYKERNMLYTMQEAANQESVTFPSPERIDKIEESMANLENVVRERNKAYWQLEVSPCATGERPAVFRRDAFGWTRWHQCSQHIVPYSRNKIFRESAGAGHIKTTKRFYKWYKERKRSHYNFIRAKNARYLRDLFRRFPNADVDYIAELHPEFPEGYIKHLRDNLHLYDDPPRKMLDPSVGQMMKSLELNRPAKLIR